MRATQQGHQARSLQVPSHQGLKPSVRLNLTYRKLRQLMSEPFVFSHSNIGVNQN
ncbi:hypothetical protein SynM161_02154 [Synechococcus sp. M16.1]|nr:hypothetical protein SynM161_02154 [Synechococcus sp. M16.1]